MLTGPVRTRAGAAGLLRGTWWPEGKNVREKADRSTDGGKTWTPVFDMAFQPHHST